MKGNVENVRWGRIEIESSSNHWRSDVQPRYENYVLADLYDSPLNM